MGKIAGIAILLVVLCVAIAIREPNFYNPTNILNLTRQIAFLAIYAMGAGIVIITGGIDLSVGSLMGLLGVFLVMSLRDWGFPVLAGVFLCLGAGSFLGWVHGFLITRVRLQPFIVTLCALLLYRGIARYITGDITKGFGMEYITFKSLANGSLFGLPVPLYIMVVLAVMVGAIVHFSVFGRHLFAVGGNEQAALYSGVPVVRVKQLAYLSAGLLSGIAAILVALYTNAIQPASHGQYYELYAIAAAVVGGCSLRGGEGTIIGVLLGASLLQLLKNGVNLLGVQSYLEYAVIGGVILIGAAVDEIFRHGWRQRS